MSEDTPTLAWSGGPLVFVADLQAPELSVDDHHHLARVRRLRRGDALVLGDGRGSWRHATFDDRVPGTLGDIVTAPRPDPVVGVGFALVKGHKPELVVQKLTEMGVDRIRPFVAARSVVRWDADKAAAALVRWQKVAREAAMQSRRPWIPEVAAVAPFTALAAADGACRADAEGGPVSLERPLVLVGPEGGWTADERVADLPVVSLGDGVLRAETAAIVAGALLTALRAGLVGPG